MAFDLTATFDTTNDKFGLVQEVKRVAGGHYRFSLDVTHTDTGVLYLRIKGFRVDPTFTEIIAPVSLRNNTTFHNVFLSPEGQIKLLGLLKRVHQDLVGGLTERVS